MALIRALCHVEDGGRGYREGVHPCGHEESGQASHGHLRLNHELRGQRIQCVVIRPIVHVLKICSSSSCAHLVQTPMEVVTSFQKVEEFGEEPDLVKIFNYVYAQDGVVKDPAALEKLAGWFDLGFVVLLT
ncbi:hypothetical protein LINPERHAP2_LOCUS12214 [Linum perenne]